MNQEKSKKLFQTILGELVSVEYAGEDDNEVLRIAMGAIASYCDRFGLEMDYRIKSKD